MFNLGQFRKTSLEKYVNPMNYELKNYTSTVDVSSSLEFTDKAINIVSNPLVKGENYYLKFSIAKRGDSVQNIKIYLKNSALLENNTQDLTSYKVSQGNGGESYFELIISPNTTYDLIVFELQRDAEDYKDPSKRVINIGNIEFDSIVNIIDALDLEYFVKIGVQGNPGLLMCINGEEIRVGRSGMYEINNGYKVNFMGFIIDDSDYFIMDYQY